MDVCISGSPGEHVHCKEKGLETRLLGQRKKKDLCVCVCVGAGGGEMNVVNIALICRGAALPSGPNERSAVTCQFTGLIKLSPTTTQGRLARPKTAPCSPLQS